MATLLTRGWRRLRRMVAPTVAERGVAEWRRDRGDRGHRFDYTLRPGAILVDAGGFDGAWAEKALQHFGATVHVFEPVPEFAAAIAARLAGRSASVHAYGLAGATRDADFSVQGDGSSALRDAGRRVRVRLRAAAEVFDELGLERVDLMKINIEGGEYELLEHLLDCGRLDRVEFLQIQFHDFVPDALRRMQAIHQRLRGTHAMEWHYPFVWESWRRFEAPR